MATATIETRIANPARKGSKTKMAKKLSAKQLKYFGTKRQKAAARASRTKKRAAPKAKHRPRTRPNAPKKHRQTKSASAAPKKKRKRKNGSTKKAAVKKRKNTGALYALVNPAGRKNKVAKAPKKNRPRKRPAGSTKKRKNAGRRTARRTNPGMGRPSDWLALGSGAIVGGLGATSLPQMVLGASNTGAMGYLGMAAATAILATAGHFMFKKNMMLTSGIIAGGAGALIKRIIGDYTPFGQYLNASAGASGLGDYLSGWNFTTPQIIGGPGNTQLGTAGTVPVSVAGAGANAGRALMNV